MNSFFSPAASSSGTGPTYDVLAFLRVLCTLLVVCIHASAYEGPDHDILPPSAFSLGVYDYMRIIMSEGICLLAVPVFFVISGYFFFMGFESFSFSLWRAKVLRRLRTLLLPFVLWVCVSLVAHLVVGYAQGELLSVSSVVQWFAQHGWWRIFWDCGPLGTGMPLDYPLWFVRDLMCVVLSSPVVFAALRFAPHTFLIVLFLSGFHAWWPLGVIPGQPSVLFFSVGGYLALRGYDVRCLPRCVVWATVPLSVILLGVMTYSFGHQPSWHSHCRALFVLVGSIALISSAQFLSPRLRRPSVAFSSFFVYALHTIFVVSFVWRIISFVWPSCSQVALCGKCLLVVFFTVVVCNVAFLLLRRFAPRLCSLLCGGREG